MPLNLPLNFKNDIQGRDTNLVPIVVIGDYLQSSLSINFWNDWIDRSIVLSTNNFMFDPIAHSVGMNIVNCKPLLLNIPSLKESIDIEKRNYKISSINIDISNFPYEGERFSELVGDSSLINKEIRIYWWSQSSIWLDLGDIRDLTDDSAFQVFFGTIRRYTHDDEKVRLVVEDRSQATLHKDLPLPENYLTGVAVPDKYKNKPIPMVYGHVDRSPTVLSKTTSGDYFRILIDNDNSDSVFGGSTLNQYTIEDNAKLYIYNGNYISIAEEGTTGFSAGDFEDMDFDSIGGVQYTTVNNYAEMKNVIIQDENAIDYNITSNLGLGVVEGWIIRYPKLVAESSYTYNPEDLLGNLPQSQIPAEYFTNLPNAIDKLNSSSADINRESSNYDFVRATFHIEDIEDNNILACKSYVLTKVYVSAEYSHYPFLYASNSSGVDEDGKPINRATLNASDVINQVGESTIVNPYGYNNGYSITINTTNIDLTDDTIWEIFRLKDADNLTSYEGNTIWDNVNKFNRITFEHAPFGTGTGLGVTTIGNQTINLYDLKILQKIIIKNPISNDFYANVKGRAIVNGTSPTAPVVIKDILETELGATNVTTINDTYGWKYAFTVDKKINSKKLIEGIASASPFIPRFNNMGEFKFDVIPENGNPVSTATVQRIKEADVIDFSFSRTKIEDVYTKIVFKYNWDYAREEFNDSVVAEVGETGGILPDYVFDYYGFTTPEEQDTTYEGFIHPDSTLVIDDDRGKYIRNPTTAQDFANWYLMWSCNQHLKMKIKLPLKYMNLEIGDFVDFDAILGGVKPYGINYIPDNNGSYGERVNKQKIFKNFLITSTNKTLEWVEIECIQMHNLDPAFIIYGCTDENACNYNSNAEVNEGCLVLDCFGECGGDAVIDCCTVCGGGATSCVEDCAGVCGGAAGDFDDCGVCGGDGQSCLDCDGVVDGTAMVDNCNHCVGGTTGEIACIQDCAGVWGGDALVGGCDNACGSTLEFDECGMCGGNSVCGLDCSELEEVELWGVWYPIDTWFIVRSDAQLVSQIPSEIGCLTNLEYLQLDGCGLTGSIPSSIGNLTKLIWLDLYNNQLSGSIPPEIYNLTNLEVLNLYDNELTGEIPEDIIAYEGIESLTNLEVLDLSDNQLTGGIPGGIGQLTNLTALNLMTNQLTGEIPPSIGQLTNLDTLSLYDNELTGEIPPEIGNLTDLFQLFLGFNNLSGEIPDEICDQGDGTPNVGGNKLCPHDFGTESAAYPECLTSGMIGEQDTTNCEYCVSSPGDINNDGGFNVLDCVTLANCVLANNCADLQYGCAGDMNSDGLYNILDLVILANCLLANNCG